MDMAASDLDALREEAWVGDSVLSLFAREWILQNKVPPLLRSDEFRKMTCNQFLSGVGQPTKVEAKIGRIYREQGLLAAFEYIESNILPLYLKQSIKQERSGRKTVKR